MRDPGRGICESGVGLSRGGIKDGPGGEGCGAGGRGADDGGGFVEVFGEDLVVAVGADVAEGERGVGCDLLLGPERPGEDGRGGEVGLDGGGRDGRGTGVGLATVPEVE